MFPFGKPIEEITTQDLLDIEVPEGVRIDYKLDIDDPRRADCKNEVRKDVASFANTDGGTLIIGIADNENREPTEHRPGAKGFLGKSADQIEKELKNLLNSKIEPRIPHVRFRAVPAGADHFFIVVGMEGKSWAAPHWVELEPAPKTKAEPGKPKPKTTRTGYEFYQRRESHVETMSYAALTRAFQEKLLSQSELQAFRDDCLSYISSGRTPCGELGPSLILHMVPYGIRGENISIDISSFRQPEYVRPLAIQFGWPMAIDDGLPVHFFDYRGLALMRRHDYVPAEKQPTYGYSRLFRNGATEQVDCSTLSEKGYLSQKDILSDLRDVVDRQLELAESLGVPGPYEIFFTIWNVEGLKFINAGRWAQQHNYVFPGVRVSSREAAKEELIPLLHHVSQTMGLPEPPQLYEITKRVRTSPLPWDVR